MQLSELDKLKNAVINELNTIESIEIIDYVNGKLTAINHSINKALTLSINDELDQQAITDLNQFCSDRLELFRNSPNELDKGMADGYKLVKNVILGNYQV